MLLGWREIGVVTTAGYILGFPGDTPEKIVADVRTIQRELPIDILEFFFLTPLPGSEDHARLAAAGADLDPDLNRYDLNHVTTTHDSMSREEWERAYRLAWETYYSDEHVRTLMRRSRASGLHTGKILGTAVAFYGSITYEGVHPLESGLFRRRYRTDRRPGLPIESPLAFWSRHLGHLARSFCRASAHYLRHYPLRWCIDRGLAANGYTDEALEQPGEAEGPGRVRDDASCAEWRPRHDRDVAGPWRRADGELTSISPRRPRSPGGTGGMETLSTPVGPWPGSTPRETWWERPPPRSKPMHSTTRPTILRPRTRQPLGRALGTAPTMLAGLALGAAATAQGPPTTDELATLFASDAQRHAAFGDALAVDGDLVVVGVPRDDRAALDAGAAYLFRGGGDSWVEEAKLLGPGEYLANFGDSVDVDGERVIVGAPLQNGTGSSSGAAHVFRHGASGWILEAVLTHDGFGNANLGHAVGISGEVAVVGAPLDFANGLQSGAAYVYRRSGHDLEPRGGARPRRTRASSTTSDAPSPSTQDVLVVGSPFGPSTPDTGGVAYVFEGNSGGSGPRSPASTPVTGSRPYPYLHGSAPPIAVSDDTSRDRVSRVPGLWRRGPAPCLRVPPGHASTCGTWRPWSRPATPNGMWSFGQSVALDLDHLVVGGSGYTRDGVRSGAAYVFERQGADWRETRKLDPLHRARSGDGLGQAVATQGIPRPSWAPPSATTSDPTPEPCTSSPPTRRLHVGEPLLRRRRRVALPAPVANDSAPGAGSRLCQLPRASVHPSPRWARPASLAADLAPYAHDLPADASCLLFAGTTAVGGGQGVTFRRRTPLRGRKRSPGSGSPVRRRRASSRGPPCSTPTPGPRGTPCPVAGLVPRPRRSLRSGVQHERGAGALADPVIRK